MSAGAAWDKILEKPAAAFTAPSREIFLRAASAWVLVPGRRTITRVYQVAEPLRARAHDAYHRFFREGAWSMSELWRIAAVLLLASFCRKEPVPLLLDDTLFKKSGRRIRGASWWRDAVASTGQKEVSAFGLNLVVLCLRVNPPWGSEPLSLPVSARLHRKGGKTPVELAREMAEEMDSWFPDREFDLTGDGAYASLAGSLPAGWSFASRMRRDAALYEPAPERKPGTRGRPRKRGERLDSPEKMASIQEDWRPVVINERGKERERLLADRVVLWYKVLPSRPVRLVTSRDPLGKERDDFFFTTDLSLSPEEVVYRYSGRWSIEDTFRNTKQYLGGEDPQSWAGRGPERAACFSFLLYSLIWLWYVQTKGTTITWVATPWYLKKSTPSFLDAMACLRRVLWRRRLFSTPENPSVLRKNIDALIGELSRAA
jgi:hypothetical protein